MAGCYAIPLFLIFPRWPFFLGCSRRSDRRGLPVERETMFSAVSAMFKQRINIDRPPEYLTDDDEQMRLPGCAHIVIIRQLESKDALRIVANGIDDIRTQTCRRNASFPPVLSSPPLFLSFDFSLSSFIFSLFSSSFFFCVFFMYMRTRLSVSLIV